MHGLIERINFWFNLSRTIIEPRVADYIIPELIQFKPYTKFGT